MIHVTGGGAFLPRPTSVAGTEDGLLLVACSRLAPADEPAEPRRHEVDVRKLRETPRGTWGSLPRAASVGRAKQPAAEGVPHLVRAEAEADERRGEAGAGPHVPRLPGSPAIERRVDTLVERDGDRSARTGGLHALDRTLRAEDDSIGAPAVGRQLDRARSAGVPRRGATPTPSSPSVGVQNTTEFGVVTRGFGAVAAALGCVATTVTAATSSARSASFTAEAHAAP
jgi:hypothetical protein